MSDPIAELKSELLAAAERRQSAAPPVAADGLREILPRVEVSRLVAIGAAAVAVAAAAALLFTAPWSTSPSSLARAQAALTPPPGTILHEKWVTITTDASCGATPQRSAGEFWIDIPTQRFRAVMDNEGYPPYPRPPTRAEKEKLECTSEPPYEIGGFVGAAGQVYQFVPPDRIGRAPSDVMWSYDYDPVSEARQALASGHAVDKGQTTREGRTVRWILERICTAAAGPSGPCYRRGTISFFVDPATFYPVEIDALSSFGEVTRFAAFEYLPRTAGNLALTSIRAQHPHAAGPRVPRSSP